MLTRKDYVATAAILNSYAKEIRVEVVEAMVLDFAEMFEQDNEKFDGDSVWNEVYTDNVGTL